MSSIGVQTFRFSYSSGAVTIQFSAGYLLQLVVVAALRLLFFGGL